MLFILHLGFFIYLFFMYPSMKENSEWWLSLCEKKINILMKCVV